MLTALALSHITLVSFSDYNFMLEVAIRLDVFSLERHLVAVTFQWFLSLYIMTLEP